MNINSILSKISLRTILRVISFFLLGSQVGLLAIFLYVGKTTEAATAFNLSVGMALALFFESKANSLIKERENLEKFLSNPEEVKGE